MGFLPSLAKSTTVQNESKIGLDQSNFSNAYLPGGQQALANALGGQQQYNDNIAAQQQLAQQYQGVANGQGPNPAQQMLANQTGANIAAQGAAFGSARGASANAGLAARQVGQQGAQIQQNAVGQGALLQAQQSLGAMQGLGSLYGQIGNQVTGQQNSNAGLFNIASNAQNAQNAQQLGIQNSNAAIEQANASTAQGALSGFASGTGAAASSLGGSAGGGGKSSKGMADGGMVGEDDQPIDLEAPQMEQPPLAEPSGSGPSSFAGKFLTGAQAEPINSDSTPVLSSSVDSGVKDSPMKKLFMMSKGGPIVPGKAPVQGDSPKNDIVPAKLSPGEIVIPRSHASDPEKAAAFAKAVVLRNQRKGKK